MHNLTAEQDPAPVESLAQIHRMTFVAYRRLTSLRCSPLQSADTAAAGTFQRCS